MLYIRQTSDDSVVVDMERLTREKEESFGTATRNPVNYNPALLDWTKQ
jgi:hypothetical protein